ncbi:hypothetical protein AgCh_002484 [Apium graveolens]
MPKCSYRFEIMEGKQGNDEKTIAKSTWDAIRVMCHGAERVKNEKVQTLKSEFESLKMKEIETIDEFSMTLNGLVTNIRALGETIEENYIVKKLLRAVPTKFLQITSAMEQFGQLKEMTIEEAVGSLKAHEKRIRGQTENNGGQLLLAKEEWAKREASEGQLLLTKEEWLKKSNKGGADTFSGQKNRGNFSGTRGIKDKSRDDEPALLVVERKELLLNEQEVIPKLKMNEETKETSNLWYLDNGTSNHMTGLRSKFKELDERITGQVKFGDGSLVDIKGRGNVVFKCKNGEEIVFRKVYFILTLCSNIISLGQMAENGNKVVLNGDHLWVYDDKKLLLMKVKRSANRLYKIIMESTRGSCMLSKSEEAAWLWHTRLGHMNFQAVKLMTEHEMVYGVPRFSLPKELCTGCLMSKQMRKPFPGQASFHAKKVLELIHGDLCGLITPATLGGNRYFLLFVDDFSRMMWAYMLASKDEALQAFKKFKVQVEREHANKIKVLRTDRGGEFCSKEFKEYCEGHVIIRHFTAPYTPQQNGVVERRNRTIVAMARSFLKERKVPSTLWGEAIRHSVYVLNRLPTRALTGMTPYEAWKGTKPDLGHIRVFGCVAHMKVQSGHVSKLEDKSKMAVYLGREPGTKASRLFDPLSGRISVSRDVVYEENRAWAWDNHENKSPCQSRIFVISGHYSSEDNDNSGEESDSSGENSVNTGRDMELNSESVDNRETSATSSDSEQPTKFRLLNEIYDETEEIEIEDELMLLGIEEPAYYKQAVKMQEWKMAMENEIDAIERNNTWELVSLPSGQKPIGLKWVYKLKRDAKGEIVKYKARLVAKGYVQRQGVDFDEVFASVTRLETVRLLLALAAKNGWSVHHLDVKSAFLNNELEETVYVAQPEGFTKQGKEQMVYKLIKALYGLRQAPRAWYSKLSKVLEQMGFVKCPYEHAIYTKRQGEESLIIGVYVDDLFVTGTSDSNIVKFKQEMNKIFDMSDLGKLSHYLGIEVAQGEGFTKLKQIAYAQKLLEKFGLKDCNSTRYPMEPKVQIDKDEKGKPVNSTLFKSLVGGLRYLVHTRPGIAYSVGIISRFMERPTTLHLNAAKKILRYVKGTMEYGLIYAKDSGNYLLCGYTDSDMASNVVDRRSTGGMAFYLNKSLITWVSQKQRCVALSSCEAEFMAATAAACQGVWLRNLLSQITDTKPGHVTIYIDNKSAIDLAKNPVFHRCSKHIDIRYHFIRECVERGEIVIKHVRSKEQRADVLTNSMTTQKLKQMRNLLGIKDLQKGV